MNQDKINWCFEQNKGIKIILPSSHLSAEYLKEADETLENVATATGKWKVITGYYACYNALYALLLKCGIKCEIHDCTISLMRLFNFGDKEIEFMESLKEDRIQTQYYLKKKELSDEIAVKKFVIKCKIIINEMSSEEINNIREKLKGLK